MVHQSPNKKFNRQRRGVGAIIGGVILATILVTSFLIYFLSILDADKAKTSSDLLSAQAIQEKASEQLIAQRQHGLSGSNVVIRLNNTGPISLVGSQALLYCVSGPCVSQDPQVTPVSVTLNPREIHDQLIPVSDGLTYRADIITERGNLVVTAECTVDLGAGVCSNDAAGSPPDFTIAAFPNSIVVNPGSSGTSTITLASLGGYTQDVSLSVTGLPAGATSSFSPLSPINVPAGGSATSDLTINTAFGTPTGTYTLTVTGTDGTLTHETFVSLTVFTSSGPPDFAIAANPNSVVVTAGDTATPQVVVTSLNSFAGSVSFDPVAGLPAGTSATIVTNPLAVTSGSTVSSDLQITTSSSTPPGTYSLIITAHSGALTHTTAVSLTVLAAAGTPPPPDFSVSTFPNALFINKGGTDLSQISVASLNGFNSAVSLSLSGSYAGITVTGPAPNSITPPVGGTGSSSLTFAVAASAAAGASTYTVTATCNVAPQCATPITHTAQVRVTVLSPSSNPAIDPKLIQQPQIQAIFPNPFGGTNNNGPQGLWGAVIANPSDHPMILRKLVISTYIPPGGGSPVLFCNDAPTQIQPNTGWSCVTSNVIEWVGSPITLVAHSAQTFLVQMGNPKTNNIDFPSVTVNYNVYTDFGQFTKVGYDYGIKGTGGNHAIVNAFLSTNLADKSPANVRGVVSVQQGQPITLRATIANYMAGTTVNAGASLIIDVPAAFTGVTVNSNVGFSACAPTPFADGSTQIKCSLSNALTGTSPNDARTIQFTMTAPAGTTTKEYLLYVLGDGVTSDNYTVGPVSEDVIIVTAP